jgi:hypothetical protein
LTFQSITEFLLKSQYRLGATAKRSVIQERHVLRQRPFGAIANGSQQSAAAVSEMGFN